MDATNMWGVGWNDPFMGSTGFGTQLARYQQTLPSIGLSGTPETTGPDVGMGQTAASSSPPAATTSYADNWQQSNSNPGIVPPSQGGSPVPSPMPAPAPLSHSSQMPMSQLRPSWQTPQFWDNFSNQMQQMDWSNPNNWNNFGQIMSGFFGQFNQPGQGQGGNTNYQYGYLPQQGGLSQAQGYVGP